MKTLSLLFITFISFLISTSSNAQNKVAGKTMSQSSNIEIIQFHSEHRCATCLKIEELTKEAVKSYKGMSFKLINVDEPKNEKIAEKFEAVGTAVFIYNPKTGKKKDMTDFVFMNAGNKTKFIEGMKKEINKF
jgi:thiol-disulfide isomerase/thioredoxin